MPAASSSTRCPRSWNPASSPCRNPSRSHSVARPSSCSMSRGTSGSSRTTRALRTRGTNERRKLADSDDSSSESANLRRSFVPRVLNARVVRLDPLVPRDIEHEDGRATECDLDGLRQGELAGFHDRGHRVDELAAGMTGLADRREDVVHLVLLDPGEDRRVCLLEEAALRRETGDPVVLVGERVDERSGVLGVDDRDDEFHPGGTIRGRAFEMVNPNWSYLAMCATRAGASLRITLRPPRVPAWTAHVGPRRGSRPSYAGAPSSASTSRRMSAAIASSERSPFTTTNLAGSAAARRR